MRRLLLTELTRLRWRRAVGLLVLAAVALTTVVFVVTAWTSRPVSDDELRRAEELVQQELERPGFAREVARCERNPQRWGVEDAAGCEEMMTPRAEWFVQRTPLSLGEVSRSGGLGVIVVATGLLMLAATTFVGADWTSGSMSNQLLFEPRRTRIWLAKAGAVAGVAAAVMAVLLAAFWGGMRLLAASRGIDVSSSVTGDIAATAGRAVLFAAAAALGAYAVTMLFRSTVFTLGALFAVTVASFAVMAVLGLSEAWMPHLNVAAVLLDGADYWRDLPEACWAGPVPPEGMDCRQRGTVTLGRGTAYLAALLVPVVAASVWAFRRRDVP